MIRKSEIVLYLAGTHCGTYIVHVCAKYRTISFFLIISLLFTPLLPSNPIYHQLSHRECFYILVKLNYNNYYSSYPDNVHVHVYVYLAPIKMAHV